ncbi:Tn3 family transposase [Nonomuraea diastatica]|uniref:Tn3 family transposase n=1 Tax=Nonomuraea diastatica TaxID=1848329 RepID=UPI003CCC6C93
MTTQWRDMLRVAGSLVTNHMRAYDLLRMFARQGSPTPLRQAFAECGRIGKTMHLLSMLDLIDTCYRRSLGKQLSVQESRHRLTRKICHGNAGKIRQAYREGQEDQLAALGLVLNAVVLWDSTYLSAIVDQLRAQGVPVKDGHVARLSPLGHAHLDVLGRYAIASWSPDKGLRPLGAAALSQDASSVVVNEDGVFIWSDLGGRYSKDHRDGRSVRHRVPCFLSRSSTSLVKSDWESANFVMPFFGSIVT